MPLPASLTPIPFPPRDQPPDLVRMEFHLRKGRRVGILLLVIPLVLAAYFCIWEPSIKAQVAGWAGLVFFPLCFAYGLSELFKTGPVIVLSAEGIYDRRFGIGIIPWNQITAIWEKSMKHHRFLCLAVRDPDIRRQMSLFGKFSSFANELLGFGKITLNFSGLDGDVDDALRFISRHLELLRPPP